MKVKAILSLTRFSLSVAIAFSAMAGQLLYAHSFTRVSLYTFLGVTLLSMGASALNQYQERFLDAKMGRTMHRPLPSGTIKPNQALMMVSLLVIAGTLLLFFTTTLTATLLGIFNLFWYNLVYTPLKTRNQFVLLVGALTGAIPPMIGWTASGGDPFSVTIVAVAFFMFLWQIPHFWLILLKYGKEYEAAGFTPISFIALGKHIKPILFIWVIGTSASTLFFPVLHIVSNIPMIIALLIMNIGLISLFYSYLFNKNPRVSLRSAFGSIYLYQVIILIVLVVDAFGK